MWSQGFHISEQVKSWVYISSGEENLMGKTNSTIKRNPVTTLLVIGSAPALIYTTFLGVLSSNKTLRYLFSSRHSQVCLLFWVLANTCSALSTNFGEPHCLASNVRLAPPAPAPAAQALSLSAFFSSQCWLNPSSQTSALALSLSLLLLLCPACSIIYSVFSSQLTLNQPLYLLVLCKLIPWANMYLF